MTDAIEIQLRGVSLGGLLERFADLPCATVEAVAGDWRASFIGPAWVRAVARPNLRLTGFARWWGKRLDPDHSINLFEADGSREAFPMRLRVADSVFDGRPCLALTYPPESRWPWPHVRDELRPLDEDHLLGETRFDLPGLARLPFPFLLTRGTR